MNRIDVIGIKCYAYHGCLPEETKIGCNYIVDVSIWTDFSEAAQQDDITKTIDYVVINHIVKKEMANPRKLIEAVGETILSIFYASFSTLKKASVTIKKLNPPINGDVDFVAITIEK